MLSYSEHALLIKNLLKTTPGWERICVLSEEVDDDLASAILDEAARFAENELAPIGQNADRQGARVVDGHVVAPDGFKEVFKSFAAGGWVAMDAATEFGGQGLPITLHTASQPLFERASIAFMMAFGASRAAVHLLSSVANKDAGALWVPKILSGDWTATICMSEPDAGSDAARIRTKAQKSEKGWVVSGQKIWISYGDHDLAERIGHCMLARSSDEIGSKGLSLFLVPNIKDDGAENNINLVRIEEKLGLHGSPTCALAFDGAEAILLGQEGRGLSELFEMIEKMRLLTACQGIGASSEAFHIAYDYALERRQGGDPKQPAVPIIDHGDVRRQLIDMEAKTCILQIAVLELASIMDLAKLEQDETLAQSYRDLASWMLPLVKNFGGETGFDVAHAAIQILGGAGYTKEWPVEQILRDARIQTIYEGTTGMQALDLLMRRLWREEGRGCEIFLNRARQEITWLSSSTAASSGPTSNRQSSQVLEKATDLLNRFEQLSDHMKEMQNDKRGGEYAADAYMRAAWCAICAWMACRLSVVQSSVHLKYVADYVSAGLAEQFEIYASACKADYATIEERFAG